MKKQRLVKIVFISFLLPLHLFAQPHFAGGDDITGVWKGSLYNDTTKKYLPYEIAIHEEKGKLSGYSYTLFDIDGKKEWGVKQIKIKRKNDRITIEDVLLIANDYSEPPPNKVRQQSVVNLLVNDTAMALTGKWRTNPTKEYRPLTGSLQLQRAINYRPLVLFKKLEELNLDNDLSFVKAQKKRALDMAINEKAPSEIKSIEELPKLTEDAGKPAEISMPSINKKTDVAATNPNPEKEIKPLEQSTVKKAVVDRPAKITVPVKEKNKEVIVNANEGKTEIQAPIVDKSKINSPVAAGKAADPIAKDAVAAKPKIVVEPAKEPADKFTIVTAPPAEKKKEVVADANNTNKESNQTGVVNPETTLSRPVTEKTEPVEILKEPVKKESQSPPSTEITKKLNTTEEPKVITAREANDQPARDTTANEAVKKENSTNTEINTQPLAKAELPGLKVRPIDVTAAANVAEREISIGQSVVFESDSLVLTLYDNGDVDGDTVSVLMNGQLIFAKQGLSTIANSKTIYMEKGMPDSLSMIMYAENLGSIPPNTGLLIIMDGEKRYEVRFSADLKTNAAILLRRKIKEK